MENKEKKTGSKEKLRVFLLNNVGVLLDSNTLSRVAGSSEWARRIRELRNEEGYDIQTHKDRSDLKPGQYILASLNRKDVYERAISKETRAFVIDPDGNTCQMCGVAAGEIHPFDGRLAHMQLGHILDKSKGEMTRLQIYVCSARSVTKVHRI